MSIPSDLDRLRNLRQLIAEGECTPRSWERWVPRGLMSVLYDELHEDDDVCNCDDRAHVVAGLDRLIARLGAGDDDNDQQLRRME